MLITIIVLSLLIRRLYKIYKLRGTGVAPGPFFPKGKIFVCPCYIFKRSAL
jgi:hypothetical protein